MRFPAFCKLFRRGRYICGPSEGFLPLGEYGERQDASASNERGYVSNVCLGRGGGGGRGGVISLIADGPHHYHPACGH